MKKVITIIAIILIVAVLGVVGIRIISSRHVMDGPGMVNEPAAEPIDGGHYDKSDPNASKEVKSEDLTEFYFDGAPGEFDDEALPALRYMFSAKLEGGKLSGVYTVLNRDDSELKKKFTSDKALMVKLNEIIKSYDLPSFNGLYEMTAGIPNDYGAELEAVYASGETIEAYSNDSCFISVEAFKEIERLFAEYAGIE